MSQSNIGIYKITSPSNKVYIGQSWNLKDRIYRYKNTKCKYQPKIYNSINKHGWEKHDLEILIHFKDNISQLWLDWWEQFFMDYYRSEGVSLLNIREAGSRGKHSEETKIKLRNRSPEIRKKISDFAKTRIKSEAERKKLSIASKGRKLSEEAKKKIAYKSSLHRHSEETKLYLRSINGGDLNKMCRPVLQYSILNEFLSEWPSISTAAKTLDLNRNAINNCCAGRLKTSGGFIWKYKNDN